MYGLKFLFIFHVPLSCPSQFPVHLLWQDGEHRKWINRNLISPYLLFPLFIVFLSPALSPWTFDAGLRKHIKREEEKKYTSPISLIPFSCFLLSWPPHSLDIHSGQERKHRKGILEIGRLCTCLYVFVRVSTSFTSFYYFPKSRLLQFLEHSLCRDWKIYKK